VSSQATFHDRAFAELGLDVRLRSVAWPTPDASGVNQRRALVAEGRQPWRAASWAIGGGGIRTTSRYVCAEVRNADLPVDVAPETVVARFLTELDVDGAVVALTSANIAAYATASAQSEGLTACALVTAGLANALRVGESVDGAPCRYLPGTINLACWVNAPLTFEAQLEAISVVTQARTLEILDARVPSLEQNGWATGTGTDCISLFSLDDTSPERCQRYAGLHTAVGRVLGRSVRDAVAQAVSDWKVARVSVDFHTLA
jgi:adenosylcobinamide amidohydrolase